MIVATFPHAGLTAAADTGTVRRTVTGVAVPWDVQGVVAGGQAVVFHPGSLDASTRPVLLRDHDRARPIGVVVDAVDTGTELQATGRVSAVPDGDAALVLAADGALPMFSVGAQPTDADYDDDGVLHVHAAEWLELSLLSIGAYAGARVSSVTATRGVVPMSDTTIDLRPTASDDPPDDDDDTEPNPDIEPDLPARPAAPDVEINVEAARALPVLAGARRRPTTPDLTLRALGPMIHAARAGNRNAAHQLQSTLDRCTVEAALADITMVGANNVSAMYRPAYQAEIVEIVDHGSPLVNTIRQGDLTNGDFPNKTFIRWTATPQVALQTAEKAEINSTPANLAPASVPVQTWATGNDISRQTLDLGPPSFVEEWVRAASVDYSSTIETYAVTALLAAATNVVTAADATFITVVQQLLGALNPANVPAGRLFIACSYDVGVGLVGVQSNDGPAFWQGSLSLDTFMGGSGADMGGLHIIISPAMPARTYLLGLTNAATWYDAPGTPFTLQAVNVGRLGLDIGLYGYGALGVQFPAALVKTTQPAS